ncbi:MAG TPA: A/G-specific adenine glycosylase, partial [Acidobacteriota bacterium]|nr:A/G-specific adenine glycosylase [Acidobacteriota bacterium]
MNRPVERISLPPEFWLPLLDWYGRRKRRLPWRRDADPYRIWVSEVMLQQTRVETVIPYFERFIGRFPTLRSLAEAEKEEVLALWSGLGYYSRARNLLRCARKVHFEFDGEFPRSRRELLQLPGIGPYTAGAILSIAFGQPEPALDGNVRRLLSRVLDLRAKSRAEGDRILQATLEQWVAHPAVGRRIADFNQALMELGALICTPARPDCALCPVNAVCNARLRGAESRLPPGPAKATTTIHHFVPAVVRKDDAYLMRQSREAPYLEGFWEFPKVVRQDGPQEAFRESFGLRLKNLRPI